MPDDNVYDTRPQGNITAILDPPWWAEIAAAKNGCIVQVHHPQHGWLALIFTPEFANKLGMALVKQAALVEYFANSVPPSTVSVN
jgi:hypothetical protein